MLPRLKWLLALDDLVELIHVIMAHAMRQAKF
jgi:hypothetical protein